MIILDMIRKSLGFSNERVEHPRASFATRPDCLYAPISGVLVDLSEISDEVISSGLFGRGYGIVPVGNTIYAPADGRVAATTVTNHSIGLRTDTGVEVVIHVGIDTINMEGKGFTRLVESEQKVSAGDPLLVFDSSAIKAAGYEDVVTIMVANPELSDQIKLIGDSNTFFGGHPLVKIGDPLVVVKR
ncbi:MAG: PTS glucose transporter subunit IIA [Collinsella sp.]|nr:PTS glucose transporter subunit IIA [Collinsella sp.]